MSYAAIPRGAVPRAIILGEPVYHYAQIDHHGAGPQGFLVLLDCCRSTLQAFTRFLSNGAAGTVMFANDAFFAAPIVVQQAVIAHELGHIALQDTLRDTPQPAKELACDAWGAQLVGRDAMQRALVFVGCDKARIATLPAQITEAFDKSMSVNKGRG